MRDQFPEIVSRLDRCMIAVEACTGAFYWARKFERLGHQVRIISPQHVSRLCDGKRMTATMPRRSAQLHVSLTFPSFRRRRSNNRIFRLLRASGWSTAGLQSSARSGGYCSIVGSQWRRALREARRLAAEILADTTNELTALAREAISELYDLFRDLDRRIAWFDKKIDRIFLESEPCRRIASIKGFGPKTATAIIAAIGDGSSEFKNGRHFAAWIGLVPRQFSSGDRKVLMGISKRGSQHLRSLLVHGARRRPNGALQNGSQQ